MTTHAVAAASAPHTPPRHASGPGRIKIQFRFHHSLILNHTFSARVHRDMSPPPPSVLLPFRPPRFPLGPLSSFPPAALPVFLHCFVAARFTLLFTFFPF